MLGESALEYIPDARARLCKKNCHIIPATGRQCIQIVECPAIRQITHANNWNGIKLDTFNVLQDTVIYIQNISRLLDIFYAKIVENMV